MKGHKTEVPPKKSGYYLGWYNHKWEPVEVYWIVDRFQVTVIGRYESIPVDAVELWWSEPIELPSALTEEEKDLIKSRRTQAYIAERKEGLKRLKRGEL